MNLLDRKKEVILARYLPDFMQIYKEIKAIHASEEEVLKNLWCELTRAFRNNFINYADKDGIELFEEMMSIKPNINDSLEVRRDNILLKWNSQPPYTWIFLKNFLNSILGEGTHDPQRNLDIQELRIISHITTIGTISNVYNTLRYLIPANMTLIFDNKLNQDGKNRNYLGTTIMTSIIREVR